MTDMFDWYEWPDHEDEFVRGHHEGKAVPQRHSARAVQKSAQARGGRTLATPRRDPRTGNASH